MTIHPTTQWIVQHRPNLRRPTPGGTLLAQHDEWEASAVNADPVRVRTLFLRGSECRFHCTMCDLWQHTHVERTRPGDVPRQIQQALGDLTSTTQPPVWLKLYNASSFFDDKNVPVEDLPKIANLVSGMQRVIVENHPRLLDSSTLQEFVELMQPARLEVAMGLETVHVDILQKLNKQMTVRDFGEAVDKCHQLQVSVRAFVLLQTPWLEPLSAMHWCQATIEAARDLGVRHISVIPVRSGNGALEQLANSGQFVPPTAQMLERILAENLARGESLLTADLWDWDRLRGTCSECSPRRRVRLAEMNLRQRVLPAISCEKCDVS